MVNSEYLAKFKKLYKDKYNIDLTDEQTTELGTHYLNLMKILLKPKTKTETVQEEKQEDQPYLQGESE